VYRIRVDLEQARPPIWRRLDVRSDLTLDTVHQVLQGAFGWADYHLHRFALGGDVFDRRAEHFLCPFDVEEGEDTGVPASEVRLDETLTEPGDVLRYCYDYGDSWELALRLEEVLPLASGTAPAAVCVDGRRAAPPEDCGGLRDAAGVAEVLDDPARFDVDEVNLALSDPFVGLAGAGLDARLLYLLGLLRGSSVGDELVRRSWELTQREAVGSADERGRALHPFLWFLDRVGADGLPLTAAGYLKPVDVTAAAAVVPGGTEWIGARNREVETYPVLRCRELLQRLGLLRKYRGRLLLTKAGSAARGDPERLWQHLADRLPLGKDRDMDVPAGLMALVFAASEPARAVPLDLIADALTYLGWREAPADPISERSAQDAALDTLDVLDAMATGPRGFLEPRQVSVTAAELAAAALLCKGSSAS
jgi:hypothetical protein